MATAQRHTEDTGDAPRGAAYDAVLGPAERLAARPFTDPARTRRDARIMDRLLTLERRLARSWGRDVDGPGITEHVVGRSRRLLAVPDGRALLAASDVTAVGFFGALRPDVDHEVLFDFERRLAQLFPSYAPFGFLSYFDVGPEHGRYGNLILFWTPDVPVEWHRGEVHREAVAAAPHHYRHIRLHRGRIDGPLMGGGGVRLERTAYLDFAGGRPWRALRRY